MDAPLPASGHETKSKSRASSCTTCRQAKLKCNLRESYPNSCSRCVANGRECKTDASFRRIPARSRVKDLESQLERLRREHAITKATSEQRVPPVCAPDVESRSSSASLGLDLVEHVAFEHLPNASPTTRAGTPLETNWLDVPGELVEYSGFTVEGYTFSYANALELFQHFQDRYYPHFCILEPITSLHQLHRESPFLFWAIISVASRNHRKYVSIFEVAQLGLDRLQAAVLATAVRSLFDLQGLLLLCAYPYYTSCEMQPDHTWTLLGSAISAAKQLGLDKSKDEVSFEGQTFQDSVLRHSHQTRRLTWIKCFELDVQLSCWHGHSPSMASPYIMRTMAGFCNSIPSAGYAAMISVDIELARSLAVLEAALHSERQSVAGLVQKSIADIDAVKQRWRSAWTVDAELEVLTAKLYLYGIRLAELLDGDFLDENIFQASLNTAVKLATLTTDLNSEGFINSDLHAFHKNQHPLPGHGKHRMRSAFFAGVVLLKYLDSHQDDDSDRELARNAFGKIFQMFSNSTSTNMIEIANAARILETAGRVVHTSSGHMQPRITTRMGASLVDNTVWLSSQLKALEIARAVDLHDGSRGSPEDNPGSASQPASTVQQVCDLPYPAAALPEDVLGAFW